MVMKKKDEIVALARSVAYELRKGNPSYDRGWLYRVNDTLAWVLGEESPLDETFKKLSKG